MTKPRPLTGRFLARAQAMQLLFQAEQTARSVDAVLSDSYALSEGPAEPYAQELARGAQAHAKECESRIAAASQNWDASRISAVDMAILKVALYEMLYCKDIDIAISISEAVDLAKLFAGDDSYKFVNGILGAVGRQLEDEAR